MIASLGHIRSVAMSAMIVASALAMGSVSRAARAQGVMDTATRRTAVQSITLEQFDDASAWTAAPSDGVSLALRGDSGVAGRALRLDFDFHGHAGYAVARRAFKLPVLPEHWAMTLHVRGDALPNTLEIKFVDVSGQDVWWMRKVPLVVTHDWSTIRFRTTDLSFAWGPRGGGPPRDIASMEIAITAGAGGRGHVELDDLVLVPLPMPVADSVRPVVRATSSAAPRCRAACDASSVVRADFARAPTREDVAPSSGGWRSKGDGEQSLTFDFRGPRELSGLALDWDARDWATDYDVQRSDDGNAWTTIASMRGSAGGRRFVHLPELETPYLRLALHRSSASRGYRLASVHVLPANAAPTRSAFLETVAGAAPLGNWPRSLTHQQQYWTVLGVPRDERDALISEDGAVESRPGSFSLEPFLYSGGTFATWSNATITHSLDSGWRPIPTARREAREVALETTAFVSGNPGHSVLWARYRVVNRTSSTRAITLGVAARPVQVNPPWQFLGTPGGAATIRSIRRESGALVVNDTDVVVPVTPGQIAGVRAFDAGDIVDDLRANTLANARGATFVRDSTGFASGALAWALSLAAHDSADVWVALPASRTDADAMLRDIAQAPTRASRPLRQRTSDGSGVAALDATRKLWDRELGDFTLDLPGSGAALARTVRTSMANVLINARGPAIQPGTRSYRRSWIRDGALTSAALMRLGHAADARAFLDWFVPNVFADGKVPCCVDVRGADPVTENDADGELLYLAAEYFRMTRDSAAVRAHWPVLSRVAAHLDSLRSSRRTPMYQRAESLLVFGLLPPSISHEGYSSKPAYSYWDDWWGVRGLGDAALLARIAGDGARATALDASATQFRSEVIASIARAMKVHNEPVMPGAAELGDFDPTSSTMALSPAQAEHDLPASTVRATFDSAWKNFTTRRGTTWEIYTPYEWRMVGSMIRLGQPQRAHEMADWYMQTRRPAEWNEWSEAIWHDARAPKFIGDMPHGWVASDFIRSTMDMLAYERERDSALVVGAGIPIEWARATTGVTASGVHTWWGTLALSVKPAGGPRNTVRISVSGVTPPGGIELFAPFGAIPKAARVNGVATPVSEKNNGHAVMVRAPAVVELDY